MLKIVRRTAAALVFLCASGMIGQAAQEASSIMSKSREMRKGLTNSVTNVSMSIESGEKTVTREMRQFILEVTGDGNRTINVFSEPADVSGVSVLTHSSLNGDDKQWLFLPSVGRVKRISSSNRSGAFVGSDFAYEDLASFEVEKYSYESVERTDRAGRDVFAVTYRPEYSGSGYRRIRAFIDTRHFQPVEIQYFNRRGEHFKTLALSQYKAYGNGRIWRPHRLVMSNHRNGSVTSIDFSDFRANGTAANNFNSNQFQKVQ